MKLKQHQLGTQTYNDFNEVCTFESEGYNIPEEVFIQMNIVSMLISGMPEYQQLILDHTTEKMFSDKSLKELYIIIKTYVEEIGIKKLNKTDLLLNLKDIVSDKALNYIDKLDNLYKKITFLQDKNFATSANAKNEIERLHKAYKNRAEKYINRIEQVKELEKELEAVAFRKTDTSLIDLLDDYTNNYSKNTTIKTFYPSIDNLIGGFQGGNFTVLAAATGMGKTAAALNLILKMAENNIKVVFFSLEMNNTELLTRIISNKTGILAEKLRLKTLSNAEWDRFYKFEASDEFEKLNNNIQLQEKADMNINKFKSIVRRTDADIIFCDYLGLISGNKKNNSYEEVSEVSRSLKLLAIETNKPIIALHQLNRDSKNRKDKHPTLSDIRDSGKIEQDADFIFMLYRPVYYNTNEDKTKLEFMVAKSRHSNGAGKIAQLEFNSETQQIKDKVRFI